MSLLWLLGALVNFALGCGLLFGIEHLPVPLMAKCVIVLNLVAAGMGTAYALEIGDRAEESEETK